MNQSIKFIIAAFTVAVLLFVVFSFFNQYQETERLSHALDQTVQQLKKIETRSGELAAENEVMQLKLRELTILYPSLVDEISNLRIRPRRAEQISTSGFRAEKNISVPLTDSLIDDSIRLKVFSYQDKWYNVHGQASDDMQHLQFLYQDTLVQVIYLGKRYRPWLWVFSPRRLRQRVMLKNPDGKIGYAQVVQIERRK